ncbi:cbb3-type cytochrome oxidase assembly protein CcoS [Psychromonas sp. Urea-02u-13]|uniref:cbb3-type cytochrome oxidase assembly protein CcoS n=1 Tax=Psychromonas sp. Urea-02u-13 TaxID=2058326 RepID=UPI000C3460B9|nr:cbb3-type cytochrome oxidase assembly protein CcoS [Psychromonas sp. Urea-02u-13]PKG38714.1 cbb3-type cytochrome oxidase assembly protein CcoS [Psychromonas sp. Urea-02u-13]
MSIIYVLIPIAMLFVGIAVWVFFWAVKSDQYEDLDREGINILFDEDLEEHTQAPKSAKNTHNKDGRNSDK